MSKTCEKKIDDNPKTTIPKKSEKSAKKVITFRAKIFGQD